MGQTRKLGVDIGGVIMGGTGTEEAVFRSDNYLATPPVEKAMTSLAQLNRGKFKDAIYLVSKSGPANERKTLHWLAHHRFYEITGISQDRVHFCRQREEKAGICKDLGITDFVDDKLEVLSYLVTVQHKYLFRPDPKEVDLFVPFLREVEVVNSWEELLDVFEL